MLSQFKVGHYTNREDGTGCTVIIPPKINISSASAMGLSPGSREVTLLQPDKKIEQITALFLTGGSAFGLGAAQGIVKELADNDQGYPTAFGVVPIVPGAVIFDKNIGNPKAYPTEENAVQAFREATYNNNSQGTVGAGTAATVGKWAGHDHLMMGGLGLAHSSHGNLKVSILTVINSVGDIINFDGSVLAGGTDKGRLLAAADRTIRLGKPDVGLAENTVLCAVLTNAKLDKQQAFNLAQQAHLGIGRRIEPSHTTYDGDVAFTIATNEQVADINTLSMLVVDAVERSIINGIKQADSLFNIPCFKLGSTNV